jgi:hypothetical protein
MVCTAIGDGKPPIYVKNEGMLSSGKVEWIEELKRVKGKGVNNVNRGAGHEVKGRTRKDENSELDEFEEDEEHIQEMIMESKKSTASVTKISLNVVIIALTVYSYAN